MQAPENRCETIQDEYSFAASEIKDVQIKTSQERVESKYCLCLDNSYNANFTEVRIAFVSRYGELVPDERWSTDSNFNKSYRTVKFSGYIDQEQIKAVRNALSKLTVQSRAGKFDPEKFAAPFPGAGGGKPSGIGQRLKKAAVKSK